MRETASASRAAGTTMRISAGMSDSPSFSASDDASANCEVRKTTRRSLSSFTASGADDLGRRRLDGDDLDVEVERLAGERVVEVELHGGLGDLDDDRAEVALGAGGA